jgi:hypothetical protein
MPYYLDAASQQNGVPEAEIDYSEIPAIGRLEWQDAEVL